jgi:hypothetical protein
MRTAAVLAVALTGCVAAPPMMARMEPVTAAGQDVRFKNGTPVVFSRGNHFDVAVSPRGGPTGRYRVEQRLAMVVGVRNRSDHRVEVSESSITATGNGTPGRIVTAAEIEDSVLANAALAQDMNALAGALRIFAASSAGTTTFTATSQKIGEPGSTIIRGESNDAGAAMQAQRHVAQDTAHASEAIRVRESNQFASVATLFQRNTIEPGETYAGVLFLEPDDVPCKLRLSVSIDGELHQFAFDEIQDAPK